MFKKNGIEPLAQHVYLSSPTMHGEEFQYMKEAYDTNWMSTVGANINEVEKCASEKIGCKHAVALSSGTAALHMAIKLAGMDLYGQPEVGHGALEGKRVFCSDMTFAATVNPVVYEGGIPVFIDTERDTWNMDPVALEKAFEVYPEVKLVVVAHLYGTPAKVDEIKALCEEYKVPLIEDAAESLGATYKGVQTGRFGVMAGFSFNGNKIITTSGGGMIASENEEYIKHATFLATQAKEPVRHYEHKEIGYNYRMSNITAGVGRGQLLHLDEHIAKKKAIYETYKDAFKDYKQVHMNPYETCSEPNFWLSCMTIDEDSKTKPLDIIEALERENIESRPIWKPLHQQPVFKGCEFYSHYEDDKKPVSEDIFDRGLCLPSDIKNTKEDMDRIIGIIRSVLDR